jgi:hypothetical protein
MSHSQIEIYQGEIWQKSGCLDFENAFVKMLEQMLSVSGYTRTDNFFVWQKQQRRVYIAVVDDVVRFNVTYDQSALDLMTAQDLLVTDNWIARPTRAQVCALPRSWSGIYAYSPDAVDADIPPRDFGLCVNRLDHERLAVFCELARITNIDQAAYVNVNCTAHDQDLDPVQKQKEFARVFSTSIDTIQHRLGPSFEVLKSQVPYRNHGLTVEQVHAASRVNLVMETYYQDNAVALSEKIFRALVTARPWVLYAGRSAVARLRQLGFDVLDDVVDHNSYDELTSRDIMKYQAVVATAQRVLANSHTASRIQQAADHNQQHLFQLRSQLAQDLGSWFRDFTQKL